VYRLRTEKKFSSEDRGRRFFLTLVFAIFFQAAMGFLRRAAPLPDYLGIPLTFLALIAAVEVADRVWLERFRVENPSELEILRGLSSTELRRIEDSMLITREFKPGATRTAWRSAGRPLREFARLAIHYWPVTLYALLQ
jgi:hypothetical protein